MSTQLISPSRPMTSAVWQYFAVNYEDCTKAICLLCEAQVARGGMSAKSFNTQNMKKHLELNHKEICCTTVLMEESELNSTNLIEEADQNDNHVIVENYVLRCDDDDTRVQLLESDSMDEIENFCKNLAHKIRRIHMHSPKLASELQYKIQEEIYLKEIEIYS